MIFYNVFVPGGELSPAALALDSELRGEDPDMTYSQMMRFRLAGNAASEATDTYFIATSDDQYVARLWYGWGKHENSIGNFGNFKTLEKYQRQGIGRKLLEMLDQDRKQRNDLPLALFCTSSKPHLVRLYGEYGFRPAIHGMDAGPLYCPLTSKAETFQDFCREYYLPAKFLCWRPATIGWRHEIDCLLRFYLKDHDLPFGLPDAPTLEFALLNPDKGKAELAFTDNGHCVGWAFTSAASGEKTVSLCPVYQRVSFL